MMPDGLGGPLVLIGILTLLGTVVTLLVAPLTPRDVVPVCCRRRVDAFAAHARVMLLGSLTLLCAGVLFVLLGAA
jgi:hypothetical protein